MDGVRQLLGVVLLLGLIAAGCGAPTPEVVERTDRETVVVTRVITATPESIPTPRPEPSLTPTPSLAVESLQELVAAVITRTDYVYVEARDKAANFYVTLVDENVRAKLVAYRAARDGLSTEQQARLLQELEARLEERNEFPVLLFVQPAEGTSLELNTVSAGPIEAVDAVPMSTYLEDTVEYFYTYEDISPVRFDSVLRRVINGDVIGFYYYQRLRRDGQLYLNAERDVTFRAYVRGRFLGVSPTISEMLDPYAAPSEFGESCYIDLLPTEPSLILLSDVVAEYVAGSRPNPPPPSEMGVNVQWDLSASDILTVVDILLTLLTLA